jgi:hypothetical protein
VVFQSIQKIIYPEKALIIATYQPSSHLPCSTKVSRGVFVQEQDITLFRLSKKISIFVGQ